MKQIETVNPQLVERLKQIEDFSSFVLSAYENNLYQCIVRRYKSGVIHLSIKRHDRAVIREWRHLQAIKNEIAGPERLAVEIFPPERALVDTSNEFHLWVLAPGETLPFGYDGPAVCSPKLVDEMNARNGGKARQQPWEPGLPTGLGAATEAEIEEYERPVRKALGLVKR